MRAGGTVTTSDRSITNTEVAKITIELKLTTPSGQNVTLSVTNIQGELELGTTRLFLVRAKVYVRAALSPSPNAQGLGLYSGKETFLLVGWLGSWAVLHFALRHRNVHVTIPMIIFTLGMAIATLFVYTPFIDFVLGK